MKKRAKSLNKSEIDSIFQLITFDPKDQKELLNEMKTKKMRASIHQVRKLLRKWVAGGEIKQKDVIRDGRRIEYYNDNNKNL